MKDNKNLKTIGIIVAVVAVLILACVVGGKDSGGSTENLELSNDANTILANAQQESEAVKDSEKKEFVSIDVNKYLEYYAGSEAKIIYLARPTCSYCQIATPIIQGIMFEYNIEVNYLNTDEFTDEGQTAFVKSDEFFSQGYGTPVLFIVKDNAIVDKVDGMTDKAHYIQFFKTHGYIK